MKNYQKIRRKVLVMSNYNIKELREKLDRCKNMDLKDVSLDDVMRFLQ